MVRLFAAATLAGLLSVGSAFAQTNNDRPSPAPPAVATGNGQSQSAAAPAAGAKEFTESEARSRIEARGYTNVNGLKKDQQSIWRGKATKDGKEVNVAIDNQGTAALSYEDIKPSTK
jgi:hypothetical protein